MLTKTKIEEIQNAISKKINQARKFRDQSNSVNQPELARGMASAVRRVSNNPKIDKRNSRKLKKRETPLIRRLPIMSALTSAARRNKEKNTMKKFTCQQAGKIGGSKTSAAKKKSSARNGKKGGRSITVIATQNTSDCLWGLWSNSYQCWMHKRWSRNRSNANLHAAELGFNCR